MKYGEGENNTMNDLKMLIDMVRLSRQNTAAHFPLSDAQVCFDYAIIEAGKYLEAKLRSKRDKRSDGRKEWGRCGYMIVSAVSQVGMKDDYSITKWLGLTVYTFIANLCDIQNGLITRKNATTTAISMWVHLTQKWGWNATELMAETCKEMERSSIS